MPILTKVPRRENPNKPITKGEKIERFWFLHSLPLSSEIHLKMLSDAGPLQTSVHRFLCPLQSVDKAHWGRWKSGATENGFSFDLLLFLFVTHPSASKDIPRSSFIMPLRSEPPFCWALPPSSHMLCCFSHVQLYVILWTVACQSPLSMGFSRQEYWSGLQCPPPGDLPDAGIEPLFLMSPYWEGGFFTTSTTWESPSS